MFMCFQYGTATGSCGTISWQVEGLKLRLIVMWSVPFNLAIHKSYLAIGNDWPIFILYILYYFWCLFIFYSMDPYLSLIMLYYFWCFWLFIQWNSKMYILQGWCTMKGDLAVQESVKYTRLSLSSACCRDKL